MIGEALIINLIFVGGCFVVVSESGRRVAAYGKDHGDGDPETGSQWVRSEAAASC